MRRAFLARYGSQDVTRLLGRRLRMREELLLQAALIELLENENSAVSTALGTPSPSVDD